MAEPGAVFAVSKMLMRRIFQDYLKAKRFAKRGGGAAKTTLDEALGIGRERNLKADDLYEAPDRLEKIDPLQARIVDLHFFHGFTFAEIAEELGLSVTTVKREWRTAWLWLYRFLHPE